MKLFTRGFVLSVLVLIASTIVSLVNRETGVFIFGAIFTIIIFSIDLMGNDIDF